MDILEYYTENSDFIIKEIERLFAMGEYEEAMTKALTVPSICKDIYMLCQDKALQIYETRSETQKQADKSAILKTLAGRYSRIDINIQKDITKRWVR